MKKLSLAVLVSLYGMHAQAAEVRSMGMGSVTAVGGSYLSAPTNNPALLASQIDESDDFGMILPGISVEVEDSNDLSNGIDEFQDAYDRLEMLLDQAAANQSLDDEEEIKAARSELVDSFANLDSELLLGVGASFVVAGHTGIGSLAAFADTQVDLKLIADVSENDITNLNNAQDVDALEDALDNLESSAQAIAANVLEIGLTYADNYEFQGRKLSLGLTLKNQRVDFFNYRESISTFDEDDFDADEYLNDDSNFNIDLGAVYQLSDSWAVGLSARNLISNEYESNLVNGTTSIYKIGPELTFGAAYSNEYVTVAADLELTGTEKFEGSEDDSQYASIGIEGDLFKWAQLRLGYKHDIEGNYEGKYTFGLGLAPFGVFHIDLAGQFAEDRKGALGLQLSYTF